MMWHRKFLIAMLVVAFVGCGRFTNTDETTLSGTLELNEHSLGLKAAGRLTLMNVEEGSEVKKGDLLAVLDRYDQAKKDYERTVELFKQGGANQQAVEYAALALDDQQVISPVDGVVLVRVHDLGEIVNAGSPVVVIGDRSQYWVKVFVPEGAINRIHMNDTAKIKFDGIDQVFDGHVSFVASKAEFTPRNVQTAEERVTQTFAVKVVLNNPPSFLRPGVACDVTIGLKGENG